MSKYQNKQAGIVHMLAVGVILVLVIGVGGAWVYSQQTKTPIKLAKNVNKNSGGTYKELDQKEVAELEAASSASSAPTTTAKQPAKTATSTAQSKPKSVTPAKTEAPAPAGKITISDDGCYVTAEGEAGMTLEVGAVKDNKGGSMTYTMPNKGPVMKATGGFKGMTAYGTLSSADGAKIIFNSGPITADECPAAG